jgi:hypothetical protein
MMKPSWFVGPTIQAPYQSRFNLTLPWAPVVVGGDARHLPPPAGFKKINIEDKRKYTKVKLKLSLCLTKHYAMKAYGEVDI